MQDHVNTYINEYFVGLCTHSSVCKVSSASRGECVSAGTDPLTCV